MTLITDSDTRLFFVDTKPSQFNFDEENSDKDTEESRILENDAVWKDDDIDSIQIDLESHSRLKKLRKDSDHDYIVSGNEYEDRLRGQYEKLYPKPQWAKNLSKPQKEREQNSLISDLKLDLKKLSKLENFASNTLKDGIIKMKKLFGIQLPKKSEARYSPIKSIQFHPTGRLIITSSTASKTCFIHRISYDDSGSLIPTCMRSTPIKDLLLNKAFCTVDGQDIFICGHRPFYYIQNIETGQTEKFTHIKSSISDSSILEHLFIDPYNRFVAFGSECGQVHLVSRHSKQYLTTLKMNSDGIVSSVAFNQGSVIGYDNTMLTFTEREVYLWDLRRSDSPVCINHSDIDDISTCVTSYGDSFAYGSKNGVVQLYRYQNENIEMNGMKSYSQLKKSFMNLTTSIDQIQLTHEWLIMSSSVKRDAIRLVHIPSGNRVISNWPISGQSMGYIHSFDMSPDQNHLVVGNHQGHLSLFHLNK